MIALLQDNKFMGYVEIAGAEIISNDAKQIGHTVKRFNQRLEVLTK